jgi:hypothetical protein
MFKTLKQWLARKPSRRPYVRLRLETLEDRSLLSATFTWNPGGGSHTWDVAANWQGGPAGRYPGSNPTITDDIAVFDGKVSKSFAATTAGKVLGQLQVVNGFNADIVFSPRTPRTRAVELTNGGKLDSTSANIILGNTSTGMLISGGTFAWSGGSVNYDNGTQRYSGPAPLEVGSGAFLKWTDNSNTGYLGATLTVDSGGEFDFNPSAVSAQLTTYKLTSPITISSGGVLKFLSGGFLQIHQGDQSNYIDNQGTTNCKNANDVSSYLPFFNDGGTFDNNGASAAVKFYGTLNQTNFVSFYQSGSVADTSLYGNKVYADSGAAFDAGTIHLFADSTFDVNNHALAVGYVSSFGPPYTTTACDVYLGSVVQNAVYKLTVANGSFSLKNGTLHEYYDLQARKSGLVAADNNVIIGTTGGTTSMDLTYVNNGGAMPLSIDVLSAGGTVIDNQDPAPLGWSGHVVNGGTLYRITIP